MNNKLKLTALALLAIACNSPQTNVDDDKQQQLEDDNVQDVEVGIAEESDFHIDIVSNGKVVPSSYADVYWESDGQIAELRVVNGQQVRKGDTIAKLEAFRINNTLKSSQSNMEQSRLQMYDNLIGQGYSPDASDIPESVRDIAEIKSGYRNAEASYELAKYEAEHCAIVAPISGVVANLTASASNKADMSKPLCRIISQSSMDVEFSIIESELAIVSKGSPIDVSAFAMPGCEWRGVISEVNPFVEANGMIKVKGRVGSCPGLYEGMNVSVKVKHSIGKCLSVPKTAVVMRSGRPVVFTVIDSEAQWVYVETGQENSTHIVVSSGLSAGDTIVVGGNAFLAHKSRVNIVEKGSAE